MEPTNQGEVPKLSQVIQIDEGKIQAHLGEVVRSTVEVGLHAMPDKEATSGRRSARISGGYLQAPVADRSRPSDFQSDEAAHAAVPDRDDRTP